MGTVWMVIFVMNAATNEAPSLKEIVSIKTEEKTETIEVVFHPGKGSGAKAAAYALGFSGLRGRIDPSKTDPKKFRSWEKTPTSCEVKPGKDKESFVVIIDCIEGNSVFAGIFVKKIGPLAYEDDNLLFPMELEITVSNDASFDAAAISAKLWYSYAVMTFEEEWILFHKERPLESPFKKGMVPIEKTSLSKRTFRIPRDRSVPYPLKK